jgi:ribose transport system substrate-binding protein
MKQFKQLAVCGVLGVAIGMGAPAFAADKPLRSVGVTVNNLGNPYFVAIAKGAEASAKKLGGPNVKVTSVSANYDLNTQVGQIENFIANKVDMIVVNAADPKGIAPVLRKAHAAGIVVVAVDVAAEGSDATVMSDNVAAGGVSCEYIAKQLGDKGNVVIINGPPNSAILDRVQGCKDVLARHKDIKLLSDNQNSKGDRDGGLDVMTNLLTAFPKIDGVFAIDDPAGIGADLAVKQGHRSDVKLITAVDGSPDAQNALKVPASLFAESSAQNPYQQASMAVQIGYDIMNGKAPAKKVTLLPTPAVTKDNASSYGGWTAN